MSVYKDTEILICSVLDDEPYAWSAALPCPSTSESVWLCQSFLHWVLFQRLCLCTSLQLCWLACRQAHRVTACSDKDPVPEYRYVLSTICQSLMSSIPLLAPAACKLPSACHKTRRCSSDAVLVPAGYNVCIFAYGQTGSGKTHTMAGTDVQHEEGRGINYRALDDLFALHHKRSKEVLTYSSLWT